MPRRCYALNAERLMQIATPFFDKRSFRNPNAAERFLADMPGREEYELKRVEMIQHLSSVKSTIDPRHYPSFYAPLLTKEQEVHLFTKFNFLRYLIRKNLRAHQWKKASDAGEEALRIRGQIAEANTRLVSKVVRKITCDEGSAENLTSAGYFAVMRAVDAYDWRRGFRFSTYATWAIQKNLWGEAGKEFKARKLSLSTPEEDGTPMFNRIPSREMGYDEEAQQSTLKKTVAKMLRDISKFDSRDVQVIRMRFGIGYAPHTLVEVAEVMGVSKERVRQLETRCMGRLRSYANIMPFEAKI